MKRLFAVFAALLTGLALALLPSPAWAACPQSRPAGHAFNGVFQNCPDAFPVTGFAYALLGTTSTNDQTATNSGPTDIVCEEGGVPSGGGSPCQPDAGTLGDGKVTIQYDWLASTMAGCPNPSGAANFGRNVMQVVANDGSSLLVSVGWSFDSAEYVVDFAQAFDLGNFSAFPISCSFKDSGLQVVTQTATPTTYQANIKVPAPRVHSDCDLACDNDPTIICKTSADCAAPGTCSVPVLGNVGNPVGFTPTCDSTVPQTAPGRLYTTVAPCGKSPDLRLNSALNPWTLANSQPDASGNALNVIVQRPAAGAGCAFLAATGMVSGVETLAAMGDLQVQGQGAPPTKAFILGATRKGGDVVVSFKTESEFELAGFNILTDAQGGKNRIQVNSQMIAPKGIGGQGATYTVNIPQANFKGGKTVYVEAVSSSGGKTLSDPKGL